MMYIIFKLWNLNILIMTCFWEGILNLLDLEELNYVFQTNHKLKPSPKDFVKLLKRKNTLVTHIKHNNNNISENEARENFERINEIDIKQIGDGYLCSTFEPVLFLISYLFQYEIKYIFDCPFYEHLGVINTIYTCQNSKGELKFKSNSKHFESVGKELY